MAANQIEWSRFKQKSIIKSLVAYEKYTEECEMCTKHMLILKMLTSGISMGLLEKVNVV